MPALDEKMDDWTQWPAWYGHSELRNSDLRGLEHYLLARSRIIDDGAFGIDFVQDYGLSFGATLIEESQSWLITVRQLRAVTPSGQPVWLDGEEASIEVKQEADSQGLPVFLPEKHIDIYLILNDLGPTDEGWQDRKFVLRVIKAPKDVQQPAPEGQGNNLYLGRYILRDPWLELFRRPMVRRLCAFGPINEQWEKWTKDLREKIDALRQAHFSPRGASSESAALLSSAIAEVSLEWPFLAIPSLARKLRRIHWLQENPQAPVFQMADKLREPGIDDWTGQELPKLLADLLPDPARPAVTQTIRTEFPATLHLLLKAFSGKVEYHAPIRLLHAWCVGLEKYREFGGIPEEEKRAIESLSGDASGDWAKAALMITRMMCDQKDPSNETSGHLDKMYGAFCKTGGPATPMAFFWLAKAATVLDGFPQTGSNLFVRYCHKLRGKPAPATDRLSRYIDRVNAQAGAERTSPYFSLFPAKRTSPAAAGSPDVRCVILGRQGSGRSHLEAKLHECWPALGGNARLSVDRVAPGDTFGFNGAADLLIITIPSDETDGEVSGDLQAGMEAILGTSPRARIAVAYTLADEYGVVDFPNIRLGRQGQRPGTTDREFEQFASGKHEVAVGAVKLPGGVVIGSPQGVIGATTLTRTRVLSAARKVWLEATKNEQLLNGYFIAASPAGAPHEYLAKSSERTGVLHLLGDFMNHRKAVS